MESEFHGRLNTSSVVGWVTGFSYLTLPCSHPCCEFWSFPIKEEAYFPPFLDFSSATWLALPTWRRQTRKCATYEPRHWEGLCVSLALSVSVLAMRRSCPANLLLVEENEGHVEQSQTTPEELSLDQLNPAAPQAHEWNKCLLWHAAGWAFEVVYYAA